MLSDIDEIASQLQFQTSPDIPSMGTNKTSTDDSLYTEMIRHIVDLLKDSRQPVIVHILNGTWGVLSTYALEQYIHIRSSY